MIKEPILIVMTPVRNEAWVLNAFLDNTSKWADYIIIADQMSTDGSRDIAEKYEKVILIDNNNPEFNEAERQAMLIGKAREIEQGRDAILFGLDADEIFDAHFKETEDWQRILNSKPGDVFWFKWAEICPDQQHYWISPKTYYPWMFHDDGVEPHGNYVRNMHSMRIPYPIGEKQLYYVDDFRVLHLAYLNKYRVESKRRFYCFIDWEMNNRAPVTLARSYSQTKQEEEIREIDNNMLIDSNSHNIIDGVDISQSNIWFDQYIVDRIANHKPGDLRKLPIWDNDFISQYHLKDPRRNIDKLVHWYFKKTKYKKDKLTTKVFDHLLKSIYR